MRQSLIFVCLLTVTALQPGCGGEDDDSVHVQHFEGAYGVFRAGLNVGQVGGCSTSVVQGLTDQLIEELNCISPNLMVKFSGSHTTLYSGVNPFLAATASSALKTATQQKNDSITISSAYRSLPQQYLLYRWYKAGQCGIQLAATPGSSNHQSGRAIDTPYYGYWKSALSNNGWTWLGSSDVVHFDFHAAPNVSQKSILAFQKLWNKNRSSKLAEDGLWGPATENAMANTPTSGFPIHGCVTTGKLVGAIFQGGDSANRVAGAVVTLGSQTATTGADGLYSFTVPSGTHTVWVSKAGYSSNSVTRSVTAGATVWGSMEINPVSTAGTLRGTVTDSATSQPVASASVTTGGKTATTGADGAFSLSLPAGSHSLTVTKDGYQNATSTHAVVAGMDTVVQVALVASTVDAPPTVTIASPAPGGASDLARITLTGTAVDDGGALSVVRIQLNDEAAFELPLTAGAFQVELKLRPGENLIVVTATDAAGQSATAQWTGRFRAGASGIVRHYDAMDARVANARVVLLDAATGEQIASDVTDDAGQFDLEVAAVPGSFGLQVSADGFVTHTRTLALTDEVREHLDVALGEGEDGIFAIRIIEPRAGDMIDAAETNVSGVISGLQVQTVTVNGVPAQLLGDNAFLVRMPLAPGKNAFEVVAESPEGQAITAVVEVSRPVGEVVGRSCAAAPGLPLVGVGFLAWTWLVRRRRPARDRV